jgi:hypothetical protein
MVSRFSSQVVPIRMSRRFRFLRIWAAIPTPPKFPPEIRIRIQQSTYEPSSPPC